MICKFLIFVSLPLFQNFNCRLNFILLCFAQCLNMLILTLPVHLSKDDLKNTPASELLRRFCQTLRYLMDSPLSVAFLEYFLISTQFASRLSHRGLQKWLAEFPTMQTFLPFLENHYIEALPACLTLAHSAFKNPRHPAGLALINNLANAIHHINRPDIVRHFVGLLFTGNPTIISQVSRLLFPDITMSFAWLCIRLCIPIRRTIPSGFILVLMSLYVKAVEKGITNELDMNTLKEIFRPYLETFGDLGDVNLRDQEAHFVVHLISVGVLRFPLGTLPTLTA